MGESTQRASHAMQEEGRYARRHRQRCADDPVEERILRGLRIPPAFSLPDVCGHGALPEMTLF